MSGRIGQRIAGNTESEQPPESKQAAAGFPGVFSLEMSAMGAALYLVDVSSGARAGSGRAGSMTHAGSSSSLAGLSSETSTTGPVHLRKASNVSALVGDALGDASRAPLQPSVGSLVPVPAAPKVGVLRMLALYLDCGLKYQLQVVWGARGA